MTIGRRLALVMLVLVVRSAAAMNLTGAWTLTVQSIIGPLPQFVSFVQTGSQLQVTFQPQNTTSTGTIDSATGVFDVPLPDTPWPPPFTGTVCTGNDFRGTAAADGLSVAGDWVNQFVHLTPPIVCLNGAGLYTGVRGGCGNGVLDPGETCDDGNRQDGDCCSSTCQTPAPDGTACAGDSNPCTDDVCSAGRCAHQPNAAPCGSDCFPGTCGGGTCTGTPAPAGTPCDDANLCTATSTCDGHGVCVSGPETCEDCDICIPFAGCVSLPIPTCASITGSATLSMDANRPSLSWGWRGAEPVFFGNPTADTTIKSCLFAQRGAGAPFEKISGATAPPGGLCGSRPCWRSTRSGFAYSDRDRTPEGLSRVTLTTSGRRLGASFAGGGPLLRMTPQLPADATAIAAEVQIIGPGTGTCYDVRFGAPDIKVKNNRLRARRR